MKRLILIGLLAVGCTGPGALSSPIRQELPTPSTSPEPTGGIGEPSIETPAPSGEGSSLECGIPEGCFLPPTDTEEP